MHERIQFGVVEAGGELSWVSMLTKVKNLVNLLVCNVWAMRCMLFVVYDNYETFEALIIECG